MKKHLLKLLLAVAVLTVGVSFAVANSPQAAPEKTRRSRGWRQADLVDINSATLDQLKESARHRRKIQPENV